VTEVDDADLSTYIAHLVVDVVAAPRQQQSPDTAEPNAACAAPSLRDVRDRAQCPVELAREEIRSRRTVARPPTQRHLDLPHRSGGDDQYVRGRRHRLDSPLAAAASAATTEPASQARDGDTPAGLDLGYPVEHARFLFGVQLNRRSLVMLDDGETRAFRKASSCLDGSMNDTAVRNLHAATLANSRVAYHRHHAGGQLVCGAAAG
jgi:hypothetical protein